MASLVTQDFYGKLTGGNGVFSLLYSSPTVSEHRSSDEEVGTIRGGGGGRNAGFRC